LILSFRFVALEWLPGKKVFEEESADDEKPKNVSFMKAHGTSLALFAHEEKM
jgi:hypothetical protein